MSEKLVPTNVLLQEPEESIEKTDLDYIEIPNAQR